VVNRNVIPLGHWKRTAGQFLVGTLWPQTIGIEIFMFESVTQNI